MELSTLHLDLDLDDREIARSTQNIALVEDSLRAGPCDSARITFFPRSDTLRATVGKMCDELDSVMPEKNYFYRVSPKDYHIDVFTMYSIAPVDMVDASAHKAVMPIEILYDAGAYVERAIVSSGISTFPLTLTGMQIGRDGSIVATFSDAGEVVALRTALGETMQKFITTDMRDVQQNSLVHITIGQIMNGVSEATVQKIYAIYEKYKDMEQKDICTITSVIFSHETRWMMEERSILEEYRLH